MSVTEPSEAETTEHQPDAGAGAHPTLVCLHGSGSSWARWDSRWSR